jgi:hypothetical protein
MPVCPTCGAANSGYLPRTVPDDRVLYVQGEGLPKRRRPVYARAVVAGWPVLLVGGDRLGPVELCRGEQAHEKVWPPHAASAIVATRVACPCGGPPPCLHAQGLYLRVAQAIPALRVDRLGRKLTAAGVTGREVVRLAS